MKTKKKKTIKKRGHASARKRDWRGVFLKELCINGHVTDSCLKAKIDRSRVYAEREENPLFAIAWDDAIDVATESMEKEARRRAVDGVPEPVFGNLGNNQGTGEVGTITRYSDTLLIFLLKAHKPEKYRDRFEGANINMQQNNIGKQIILTPAQAHHVHDLLRALPSPGETIIATTSQEVTNGKRETAEPSNGHDRSVTESTSSDQGNEK